MSSRSKQIREPIDPAVEAKCQRVLAIAFRGIHHVFGWVKRRSAWTNGLSITTHQDLATFDFDVLTRLVVAAHDECVRVEIVPAMRNLTILLHVREGRDGSMSHRHPTMEDAVANVRKGLTAGGWNE